MIDTKNSKAEIPEFHSYEEEARWWDTHDPLDYLDASSPVHVSKGDKNAKSIYLTREPLESSINIRFSENDLEQIRTIADRKGLGPTTLVRMWAKEKLQEEKAIYRQ